MLERDEIHVDPQMVQATARKVTFVSASVYYIGSVPSSAVAAHQATVKNSS